ncbi:hypothetical protein P691DRAFT_801146 [Macrolepiota fuliginosa MF-IS2]|uniref:SUZ domain-containing protein n=1 Tax=Macrolepiota fuliginosa MF-IS2 TaxID=1400762 RepID=A0A9P6C689_9AGAR|nr:hypothetical protein P691DRAFT_801146 [Macrolepiota fuliginosa MF-IS2]
MSFNSSSKSPVDPWGEQTSTKSHVRKPAAPPVVDDWEDDDDDDENNLNNEEILIPNAAPLNHEKSPSIDIEENRKIWDTANTGDAAPMPTIFASRAGSVVPPPPAAFQPAMRILKRPESSSPSRASPAMSPSLGGSLQEREARYAAARERIFGPESVGGESGNSSGTPSPKSGSVKIIREPKAPESMPGGRGQSLGFRGRGGKSSSSPHPPTKS